MDPESTDLLVETSALVSIVYREAGYASLLLQASRHESVYVSAANLAEALIVVERRTGAQGIRDLEKVLPRLRAQVLPFDAAQARGAHEAFRRFGKGRHPAALNFGDCLSYAAARSRGARLLYVGEDFGRTDLA